MLRTAVDQNHVMVRAELAPQVRCRDDAAAAAAEDDDFFALECKRHVAVCEMNR